MEKFEYKNNTKLLMQTLTKKQVYILLVIIIMLQILNVTISFELMKEGFHSDEMWSYGFANSFYEPLIYENDDGSPAMGVWRDGSDFGDYITVQKGEQFRPDSAWYNEKIDMHPPLYPAILHIICSFFPNTFSKYFAYLINVVAMVLGQIYLFRTASRLCKSDFLAVLICILWGFSVGFINMGVFLRAYSLITALSIMLLFYHTRLYLSEGSFKSNVIKLGIIIFIGALCHHYFLVLSFAIVACFCFYYLFKRQWKNMFIYAASMAGSVLLSIAAFPSTIDHLLTRGTTDSRMTNSMPYIHGLRYAFSFIQEAFFGYQSSAYATSWYSYIVAALVIIIAVLAPLCFLFRNEEWFKKISAKAIANLKKFEKSFDFMLLFICITIFFVLSIIAVSVNMNVMTFYTDRYVFYVMPWAAIAFVLIGKYIFSIITPIFKYYKYALSVLCCAALISSNMNCTLKYFFLNDIRGAGGIASTVNENSRYIMLLEDSWLLTVYPYKLMNCNSFFPVIVADYHNYVDEIGSITPDEDTYLILSTEVLNSHSKIFTENKNNSQNSNIKLDYLGDDIKGTDITEEKVISKFENEIFPGYKLQFVCSERTYGRIDHIFRIVPEEQYTEVPIIDVLIEYEEKQES